jgi:hypothetical protein
MSKLDELLFQREFIKKKILALQKERKKLNNHISVIKYRENKRKCNLNLHYKNK